MYLLEAISHADLSVFRLFNQFQQQFILYLVWIFEEQFHLVNTLLQEPRSNGIYEWYWHFFELSLVG